jgi:hypothetical protein
MRLSLPEAAHRLRMTVQLLEWFARYAAKRDERKLVLGPDRKIDEVEVAAFEAHLRAAWPNKNPGAGILAELERESRGRCGLCRDHASPREAAHIDRLNEELDHHCQHPHNLILLCANCHTRYDLARDIDSRTIRFAKQQLISQLMEDVDRDVSMTQRLQAFVETEGPRILAAQFEKMMTTTVPLRLAQAVTAQAETVVTGSANAPPASSDEAQHRLAALSSSISDQSPFTSRLLLRFGTSFANDRPSLPRVTIEDLVDDRLTPGRCLRCDSPTAIDRASCVDCGEDAGQHEHATAIGDGTYELGDEDQRGDVHPFACEDCGSERFEVEFNSMCDYCEHMADKLMRDD